MASRNSESCSFVFYKPIACSYFPNAILLLTRITIESCVQFLVSILLSFVSSHLSVVNFYHIFSFSFLLLLSPVFHNFSRNHNSYFFFSFLAFFSSAFRHQFPETHKTLTFFLSFFLTILSLFFYNHYYFFLHCTGFISLAFWV